MGELRVYGQYQSRGNSHVHEAYSSTVYIFDDETEMTELPHVHRPHMLLLNGQNQKWKKGSSFFGLRNHLQDMSLSLWQEV